MEKLTPGPIIRNILLSLILIFILPIGYTAGAEFYKWVGKDGVVHFSDHIPEDADITSENLLKTVVNDSTPPAGQKITGNPVSSQSDNPIKTTIDATFSIKGEHSLGTGFFISQNGYAITCKHVLESDGSYVAVFNDGSECPIGIVSVNDRYDLALIMVITYKKTSYISVRDPKTMTPGDRVFAVGNSLGLQATITDGIFTGVRQNTTTKDNVVQFSAPINPGNSGGPLIDEKGKVIGVVSWKIVSQHGIPVSGVGFAVPSDYVAREYAYYLN